MQLSKYGSDHISREACENMANEQIKQGERLEAFVGRDGEKWGG
jgi:hypothetical protein